MPDFVEPSDYLARSNILRNVASHRVSFDPSNVEHCKSLKKFLETGNWGSVMFYPEFPYTDVPTYVLAKFASFHLKAKRKTNAEAALDRSRSQLKNKKVPQVEVAQE